MKKANNHFVGVVVGSLFAFLHLVWGVLVALGLAELLIDWIYRLHFLSNPFTVDAFSLGRAIWLIIVTFVWGYIVGWVFAWIWNYVQKKK